MTTRRQFLLSGAAVTMAGTCRIDGVVLPAENDYSALFDFDVDTFTGIITEPDGTVNNLSGYHGVGGLPPLTPPVSDADVVLSGVVEYPAGFTVPSGEVWEIDPATSTTITVGGNIIVNGLLRSRPPADGVSHRIRFVGINEANIVGGMAMSPVASDVGLWVDGGVLDISGAPKVTWNTTGTDATWAATDELIVAPTDFGSFAAQPFTGSLATVSTPTLYAGSSYEITRSYAAEVFNLTRSFTIESVDGRAHVMFINCADPQRLEYVELLRMGPTNKLGRYPLHVHMNGEGTNGSLFRGNVARDCGNHAFVPHLSNGCDMSYSIAHRTTEAAFWWDPDDESERTIWNRCAAIETDGPGFVLGEGVGNSCVGSVAVGTEGNSSGGGFVWPSAANGDRNLWLFEDCVSHNNATHGFRVWQNDDTPHAITRCVAFHNELNGFSQGAYNNQYRYFQCVGFDNTAGDMVAHALGAWSARRNWIGVFRLVRHSQPPIGANLIVSTHDWPVQAIEIDEAAPGDGPANGGTFRFESLHRLADLDPSDITVTSTQLSTIEVDNNKAPSFTLTP